MLSNLQKNEELKSVLLQETPWVLNAQNETQQKKNIALLFDMVRMSSETGKAIAQLSEKIIANPADANLLHERAKLYMKQNNFQFAEQGHIFKSTNVFVISVYNDYIEFTMKQCKDNKYEPGPILKTFMFSTFQYKDCRDFVNHYNSSAPNPVFNNLISEFYQVYFATNSDAFWKWYE